MDRIDTEFALQYMAEAPRKDTPPTFAKQARELATVGLAVLGEDGIWRLTPAGQDRLGAVHLDERQLFRDTRRMTAEQEAKS